jgi:hypothetical protein
MAYTENANAYGDEQIKGQTFYWCHSNLQILSGEENRQESNKE